jgi:hypothetical protein
LEDNLPSLSTVIFPKVEVNTGIIEKVLLEWTRFLTVYASSNVIV